MITASLIKDLREKTGAGMLDCKKALEATNANIDEAVDWLREKGIAKAAKKADRIAAEGKADIKTKGNDAVILELNSETDFVAKNEEFQQLMDIIIETILDNEPKNEAEALKLTVNDTTIEQLIAEKTAKIGEKLSFRRFEKITKSDNEVFGTYIHMGGKIAVLTVLESTTEEVAKDVAMHAAAMRPMYTKASDIPEEVLEHEKDIMREQLRNEGKPQDKIENILLGKVNKYYEDVCLENQIFVKSDSKETVAKYVANQHGKIVKMVRYEVGEGMQKREENFAEEVSKQINKV